MRTATRRSCTVLLIALFLTGCARHRRLAEAPQVAAPPDLSRSPISDAAGTGAGLEVSWLISTADRQRLAVALAPYLDDRPPVDPSQLALWEANGLRLIRIPLADWPTLGAELRISGTAQRQWLAQSAGWTEIIRGPDRSRGQTVALDAERLELGPGHLRLLARCWLAPLPPTDDPASLAGVPAALVVEAVPQHRDAAPPGRHPFLAPSAADPAERRAAEGLVFTRMLARLTASHEASPAGFAYLLIPERPGVDWRHSVGPRPETADVPAGPGAPARVAPHIGEVVRPNRQPAPVSTTPQLADSAAGPTSPILPTLGEALFGLDRGTVTVDGEERPAPEPNARALIILIPRAPATYQLVAPTTGVTGGLPASAPGATALPAGK